MPMTNNPESTPTATPAPAKKKRWFFALKLTAAAVAVGALLIALTTVIAVYSIAEPKIEISTDKLLAAPPQPATAMPANTQTENHTPKRRIPTTSATLTSDPSTALHYAPFIPDTPDLPAKLKIERARLNAQFDRVLREIADYERTKTTLTSTQALRLLAHIKKDYDEPWGELMKITNDTLSSEGGLGAVDKRHAEYMKWCFNATIENCAQSGRWLEAARTSIDCWNEMRGYWLLAQDHSQPVFKSRYYQERGSQDWNRIIYYARRSGGVQGYTMITSLLWSRGKEKLIDTVGMAALRASRGGSHN